MVTQSMQSSQHVDTQEPVNNGQTTTDAVYSFNTSLQERLRKAVARNCPKEDQLSIAEARLLINLIDAGDLNDCADVQVAAAPLSDRLKALAIEKAELLTGTKFPAPDP